MLHSHSFSLILLLPPPYPFQLSPLSLPSFLCSVTPFHLSYLLPPPFLFSFSPYSSLTPSFDCSRNSLSPPSLTPFLRGSFLSLPFNLRNGALPAQTVVVPAHFNFHYANAFEEEGKIILGQLVSLLISEDTYQSFD